jgi:hypothetical protein
MATIQSKFASDAQDLVARYRRAGGQLTEEQARQLEAELEQAMITAWAENRVRQMVDSRLKGPLKSVNKLLEDLVSVAEPGQFE